MKIKLATLLIILFQLPGFAQSINKFKISADIELIKLSEKAYLYVSTAIIEDFGKVPSNGLILVDNKKAFLFDTPVTNAQTETLVKWIKKSLHAKIIGFVPNHWHSDCMGGLKYLHSKGIKSYANQMTIDIAKEKGLPVPKQGFKDSLSLKLHNMDIHCYYLGAGHSADNIVVWIPSEEILFSGCMVKDIYATGLGNLSDANIEEWPKTIDKILNKFSSAKIVIPGHGEIGGMELIRHTRELLPR